MEYRRLGRTGLKVSVLGLGTGGPNRLGQSRYVSRGQIHRLIRQALELGINFFDTSGAYEHSESLLGSALQGVRRDRYVLSSKIFPWHKGNLLNPEEIRLQVEHSLQRLRVDELDVLHLHRATPEAYTNALDQVIPELLKLRDEGKFRFLGISESSSRDPEHRMLRRALQDDVYDTVMVAYNPAYTSAEKMVFPRAQHQDVGVICMSTARHFVPRNAAERLRVLGRTFASLATSPPADIARLKVRLKTAFFDTTRAAPGKARFDHGCEGAAGPALPESTYSFALTPAAVSSVLTGTVNPTHLVRNVMSVQAPALSNTDMARWRDLVD